MAYRTRAHVRRNSSAADLLEGKLLGDYATDDDYDGDDTPDPRLVTHVERIVETWPLWKPEDPVHALIKRAIDDTPV